MKRITHKLLALHKDEFTTDFDKNKAIVAKFADVPSTKLRNVLTGYITRLKRK